MRASTPSDQVAGGKAPGDGLHERHVLAGRLTVTCPPGEATAARSPGQVLPGAGLRLRRVMRACPAPDRRLTGGPARGGGAAAEPRRRAQDAPKQWRGKFLKYKEHKKQIKAYKDECARPARRLAPRCAPGELFRRFSVLTGRLPGVQPGGHRAGRREGRRQHGAQHAPGKRVLQQAARRRD